jgi:hypothetical protein
MIGQLAVAYTHAPRRPIECRGQEGAVSSRLNLSSRVNPRAGPSSAGAFRIRLLQRQSAAEMAFEPFLPSARMKRSLQIDPYQRGESAMPLSLFESAYIRTRSAIGEDDWRWMTELQHADLICCEMHRLAEAGRDGQAEVAPPEQNDRQ